MMAKKPTVRLTMGELQMLADGTIMDRKMNKFDVFDGPRRTLADKICETGYGIIHIVYHGNEEESIMYDLRFESLHTCMVLVPHQPYQKKIS